MMVTELYVALRSVGVEERLARLAAEAVIGQDDLCSRADSSSNSVEALTARLRVMKWRLIAINVGGLTLLTIVLLLVNWAIARFVA
jgi:hypothetical protein